MRYDGDLYVPPSGGFLVVVVCVVELCVLLVLVYSITRIGSVYLTLVVSFPTTPHRVKL